MLGDGLGAGTRLFNQDSDGNMMPVLDAFLELGVNVMHPFEPAAGMDMVAVREAYGKRLAILGGIDKHVLRGRQEQIEKELQYKLQSKMHPGTVFGLDHRIPNGTPLENYRYYVRRGRELLGLPPRYARQPRLGPHGVLERATSLGGVVDIHHRANVSRNGSGGFICLHCSGVVAAKSSVFIPIPNSSRQYLRLSSRSNFC